MHVIQGQAEKQQPSEIRQIRTPPLFNLHPVPEGAQPHQVRCLVVEIDPEYCSELLAHLAALGCACTLAADTADALEQIRTETLDLVVAAEAFHDVDGLGLMLEAKKFKPSLDFLIILGEHSSSSRVSIIEAGASDYIRRPYDHGDLEARIKRILREKNKFDRLQAANRELEDIFENSPDAIGVVDKYGRFSKLNAMTCDLYGYSRSELIGKSAFELYADREALERMMNRLRARGATYKNHIKMKRKDGPPADLELSIRMLKGENGEALGSVCIARDRSDLKKAVEELQREVVRRLETEDALRISESVYRDSEQKYKTLSQEFHALLDAIPDGLALLSPDLRIVWGNRAFAAMSGKKSMASLIGRHCYSQWHMQDNPCHCCPVASTYESGEPSTAETNTGDGRIIETRAVPVRDENGKVINVIAVTRDVSEARQSEEELRRTYTALSHLVASIPSFLIELAPDLRVTRWNEAAERTFGVSSFDALGKTLEECAIQWSRRKVTEAVAKCLVEGSAIQLNDLRFWRPDGKRGFLDIAISSVEATHTSSGILLLGSEVTSRKLMESQLVQAQKLESIGQLAAGIAHEINTPAQYVGDNLRFLLEAFSELTKYHDEARSILQRLALQSNDRSMAESMKTAADPDELEYLGQEIPRAIQQSLEGIVRITGIVKAMREFSHPGNDEKSNLDLNKAIDSTITVARNEWKYFAEMVTELDPLLPLVPCLPGEFNQVILNLIINAAQAISEKQNKSGNRQKGTITVSTRLFDSNTVEIRIADTGTGIPKAIRSRIFDPFFTTKEVGKGTGQGLAISRSVIVDKHGGTIDLESQVGKGTRFIIRLPIHGLPAA